VRAARPTWASNGRPRALAVRPASMLVKGTLHHRALLKDCSRESPARCRAVASALPKHNTSIDTLASRGGYPRETHRCIMSR
jgi:hypothetical protein